tara:strand:+ start:2404 stop:4029 length:1626 start_codon:yes stop_codon:yes gene_type:complete
MIIRRFNIDTSNIPSSGSSRNFSITGDVGAKFNLSAVYVVNPQIYYYNFATKVWQSDQYYLNGEIQGSTGYTGIISFPASSSNINIELFLLADAASGTTHGTYFQALKQSGDIDINKSYGSESLMLRKTITQLGSDGTVLIDPVSLSTQAGLSSSTEVQHTTTTKPGVIYPKIPFTVSITAANGKAIKIDRQPLQTDFFTQSTSVISDFSLIPGEDQFDNGQAIRSTDTTNGATSSSDLVTMTSTVATKMAPGDRVTAASGISSSDVVTVVNTTDGSSNQFRASQALTLDPGLTLTFTEPHYYRWKSSNVAGLSRGSSLFSAKGTIGSTLAPYISSQTTYSSSGVPSTIITNDIPAVLRTGITQSDESLAGIEDVSVPGEIVFSQPQPLTLSNQSVVFLAYGEEAIRNTISDTGVIDLEITNLKAEITKPTTTVTSSSGTSLGVTSARGIMDDVSTVSSINMNIAVANPTVTNIASYTEPTATATLTLSSSQSLETGEVLTFDGAGQTVTITGDIKINKSINNSTIFIDVDKFLSSTVETA